MTQQDQAHDQEFLIRTSRTGVPDVHVSRRYGDFKRLSDEVSSLFSLGRLELTSSFEQRSRITSYLVHQPRTRQ